MSKKKVKCVHVLSVVRQNEIEVKVVSYNTNFIDTSERGLFSDNNKINLQDNTSKHYLNPNYS